MSKNILVIEDDKSIVEVMTIILEDAGYTVATAGDGDTVEKQIEQQTPDVILVDMWVGGWDGKGFIKMLKNKKDTSHTPIIMISAHNNGQMIAKEAGADAFLAKPFDMNDLLATVAKYAKPR